MTAQSPQQGFFRAREVRTQAESREGKKRAGRGCRLWPRRWGHPLKGLFAAVGGSAAPFLPYGRIEASARLVPSPCFSLLVLRPGGWAGSGRIALPSVLPWAEATLGALGESPRARRGTRGCRAWSDPRALAGIPARGEGPSAGEHLLLPCFCSRGARGPSCSL